MGATLVSELSTHPGYAAAHHLAGLTAPQTPPTSPAPPPTQTTAHDNLRLVTAGGAKAFPEPPRTTALLSPPPVLQDPLSVAVGGTLDVTLPSLGLGTTGVTFTITPQPLPANMNFNRGTGVLVFAGTRPGRRL